MIPFTSHWLPALPTMPTKRHSIEPQMQECFKRAWKEYKKRQLPLPLPLPRRPRPHQPQQPQSRPRPAPRVS